MTTKEFQSRWIQDLPYQLNTESLGDEASIHSMNLAIEKVCHAVARTSAMRYMKRQGVIE